MDGFTIAGIVFGFLCLAGIYARRQESIHNLRFLFLCLGCGLIAFGILSQSAQYRAAAPLIGIIVALVVYRLRPRRQRRMTAETKRRVIAKWELDTGKKYNSKKHEIDHIVPFSQGGSCTEDNLRIIEKSRNRSKSGKTVWWDVMGRR